MIKGKGIKLGDTLVEVTLAIGIFSMVAIAAVSVISASTSGTQSILENTLTREQIDSQAEALRFIQSAYAAEGERDPSNPTKYALLWQAISSHAISLEGTDAVSSDVKNNILNYNPTTCSALYTDTTTSIVNQNAFIINLNALGSDVDKNSVGNIVVSAKDSTSLNSAFRPATTYPRLIYGAADNLDDPLYNPNVSSNLYAAEGLFVVAVKDTSGTTIVSDDTGNIGSISAYIDFYIRSCWFATGSERPTTISTVIRLYNPDTVSINKYERKGVIIKYAKGADDVTNTMPSQYILSGTSASPLANRYERPGYTFMGWSTTPNGAVEYAANADGTFSKMYQANNTTNENTTVTLYAVWAQYRIKYIVTDDASWSWGDRNKYSCDTQIQDCDRFGGCQLVSGEGNGFQRCNQKESGQYPMQPTRSGYWFKGWCTVATNDSGTCSGATYQPGDNFPGPLGATTINLYPIWEMRNEEITIRVEWAPYGSYDYDSYIELQKPDDDGYIDVTYDTTATDILITTPNGKRIPLATGNGDGRCGTGGNSQVNRNCYEQFTINTLGGKNYYYSVKNYDSPGYIGDNVIVTISGPYTGTVVFSSANRPSGNCVFWNVFAYKRGSVVERNTCTQSKEYGY